MYYSSIDLGDSITVSTQLQKALGLPRKTESNQCVLLHVAAAYEWKEQNSPKMVPSRARVDSMAAQLRQVEYQQGTQCVSRIKNPHTRREYEIWSQAHDAMTPNHDRQFRDIPLFLQRGLGQIKDTTLRIIDIESSGRNLTANMHIFGPNTYKEISTDLTLCVWKEHMRFLIPSAATTPKSWLAWQHCFRSIHTYEWEEELEKDESHPVKYVLEPCAICSQRVRIPHRNIFNPVGWHHVTPANQITTGRSPVEQQTDVEWWGSWNPWVFGNPQPEDDSTPTPLCRYMSRGSDQLTPEAIKVAGAQFMPDCSHHWRNPGELPCEVVNLCRNTPEEYSAGALIDLARKGDSLVSKFGLYPALCSIQ